ncbi:MAG: phage tail sheath family protein, partial [Firmicutes bacterium]|nr:phage tail sheath family protein [Bacillota bacterium]
TIYTIDGDIPGTSEYKTKTMTFGSSDTVNYFKYEFKKIPSSDITAFKIDITPYSHVLNNYKVLCTNVPSSASDADLIAQLEQIKADESKSSCINIYQYYGYHDSLMKLDTAKTKIGIAVNADDENKFDVTTYVDGNVVDIQTVSAASGLESNDWVDFKTDAALAATAATALTGGTNGSVTGQSHQDFLDKLEKFSFDALGAVTTDAATKGLYSAFTRRMRDEVGLKFQCVLYNLAADYEGVISVKNACSDAGESAASAVYWVTGVTAGCEINKSNLNKRYDGEFTITADYTQAQLEAAIQAGEFTFHFVGEDLRVLADINTLVIVSDTKGDMFKENQTVRVCDQIANDIANIFNTRYLGTVPNDKAGRTSLWNDIVKHHRQLADIRAIEDFEPENITVERGDTKKSVVVNDVITVVNAMGQLYMTVLVE